MADNPFANLRPDQRQAVSDQVVGLFQSGAKLSPEEITDLRRVQKWLVEAGGAEAEAAQKREGKASAKEATQKYVQGPGVLPAVIRSGQNINPANIASMIRHPYDTGIKPNIETAKSAGESLQRAQDLYSTGHTGAAIGETVSATGKSLAAAVPFIGPWAAGVGERVGKGDVSGGLTEAALTTIGGKGVAEGTVKLAKSAPVQKYVAMPAARVLRESAEKTVNRLLRTPEGGAEVAQQGIIARRLADVQGKIRARIDQLNPIIDQTAQAAERAGVRINAEQAVQDLFRREIRRHLTAGNTDLAAKLIKEYARAAYDQQGTYRLANLRPTELLEIRRALTDRINEMGGNEYSKGVMRQLQHSLDEPLHQAIPGLRAVDQTVHGLLTAEDAAKARLESYRSGVIGKVEHWLRGGIPDVVAGGSMYYMLNMLGLPWEVNLASIMALRAIYKATPSSLLRAAIKSRIADMLDAPSIINLGARPGGQAGPAAGAPGGNLPPGQPGQPAGQPAPVTPPPTGAGGQPVNAGVAAAYQSGQTAARLAQPALGPQTGPAINAAPAGRMPAGAANPEAVSAGNSVSPMAQAEAALKQILAEAKQKVDKERVEAAKASPKGPSSIPEPKAHHPEPPKTATTKTVMIDGKPHTVTVVPEGASGANSSMRALLDEIDRKIEDEGEKSPLARATVKKVIDQVEQLAKTDLDPKIREDLERKMAQRERKTRSREKAAAQAPVDLGAVSQDKATASGGKTFTAIAKGASPEQILMVRDEIYKELGKFEGDYVKSLKAQAKALKFTPEMEYEAALEAYETLKSFAEGKNQ